MIEMDVPEQIPAEKLQSMTSSEIRKIRKPFIEKRRRERINTLLDELKELVLKGKLEQHRSKYEKADILELTVKHLRDEKRRANVAANSEASVNARFQVGYKECAGEVTRYLAAAKGVTPEVSARLSHHLQRRMLHMGSNAPSAPSPSVTLVSTTSSLLSPIMDDCTRVSPQLSPVTLSNSPMVAHPVSRVLLLASPIQAPTPRHSPADKGFHTGYRTPSPVKDENNNDQMWRPW